MFRSVDAVSLVIMASPMRSRKIFGCLSNSLVPAPMPIFRMVKWGGRVGRMEVPGPWDCLVKTLRRAAAVGVTSSPVIPGGPFRGQGERKVVSKRGP